MPAVLFLPALTIVPSTPADLAGILLIQLASPGASQWDLASSPDDGCLIAEDGGRVAGFIVFRETGPGEHEILNLAVDPSARRRGVARRLLQTALAAGPGRWFLEVRASNLGAIQLYEAVGFRPAGRREAYYHNPSEPAIVMKFDS